MKIELIQTDKIGDTAIVLTRHITNGRMFYKVMTRTSKGKHRDSSQMKTIDEALELFEQQKKELRNKYEKKEKKD